MNTDKTKNVIKGLDKFHQIVLSGLALWNSLILPILIAIFVSYLFQVCSTPGGSVSWLVWIIALIMFILHMYIVYLQFKGSNIDTMLVEYQENSIKLQKIKSEFEEIKSLYKKDMSCFSSQSKALQITSEALSFAVGKVHNMESSTEIMSSEDIRKMVDSLIWPLVVLREKLFAFRSGILWNIALYTPQNDGRLSPVWRMNDKRIDVKNRPWAPGFGVVGLAFLHKTIKYYENIEKNSEVVLTTVTDRETYKSIIAVPVIPCEDSSSTLDHNPIGVLVITSSEESQFNLDRDAQFLQTHANLVAIFIEKLTTYLDHQPTEEENVNE